METLSTLLALCEGNLLVTGWLTLQKGSNVELWCFFYVGLKRLLSKQSSCLWFETRHDTQWNHWIELMLKRKLTGWCLSSNVLQCQKSQKSIYRSDVQVTFELHGHFRCLLDLFIQNKTTFTKYCLTQWISNLPRSFETHWVRKYHVNFMGLTGIINATVYKTNQFPQVSGMANCPNF